MYLESQLTRVSRNAAALSLVTLAFLGLWLASQRNVVRNATAGPFAVSPTDLAALRDDTPPSRFFVSVRSDDAPIEVASLESGATGSAHTTTRFFLARCGGALLFVRGSSAGVADRLVGTLTPVPEHLATRVFQPLVAQASASGSRVIPLMLDADSGFRSFVIGWLVAGVVAAVLALGWLVVSIGRLTDLSRHPVMRMLAGRGASSAASREIDREIAMRYRGAIPRGALLTNSWLVEPGVLAVRVHRLDELVWVYKKVTRQFLYFLPVGSAYALVIHDRAGKVREVRCGGSERDADGLIVGIVERVPGIRAGYSH